MTPTIDIIVPVYGGLEETRACLASLTAQAQRTPHEILIINDASPDPEMAPMLEHFAARHEQVTLLHNEKNLGFVGTVNRGMRLHPERDVVLLNSDTRVANQWLDRLRRAADASPKAATVTPFSNNATICSFPRFCEYNPLPAGWSLEDLDALFARVNAGQVVEIPTGVGFCMFIRRDALNEVGLFDEKRFGRGYGEENDFCRRAAKAGWQNLLCCDTLVFHEGGVSFSSEQESRIARAQQTLDRLHPEYHTLVHQHIQQDPARIHRFQVLVEMMRQSPRHKVLHITHHLGGGTLQHVRELAHHLRLEMDSVLLRPDHDGHTSLCFGTHPEAPSILFDLPTDYEELLHLLRGLGLSRIHFHHTLALETRLWGLPRDLGIPFDITLHDYYFINAHPTQTDASGRYQPHLGKQTSSYPLSMPLEQWQANQRVLLDNADRIIAPSKAAAREISRHYPHLDFTIAFHPDSEKQMPWPDVRPRRPGEGPLKILVTGALSLEKGADLLEATAMAARKAGYPLEFHLLGYAYRPLDESVICHGAYAPEELPERFEALKPHLVWFTALWPETYSYTLSETLLTGLPLVAPDLGAFPERLQHRPLTWIEPWQRLPAEWVDFFLQRREELQTCSAGPLHWPDQPATEHFYRDRYLQGTPQATPPESLSPVRLERMLEHSKDLLEGSSRSRREMLLKTLLRFRQGKIGRIVSRVVPVNLQRRFKRSLSRKPVHELKQ